MRNFCRVCLCIDRNTFAISNTVLQEIWEKLTNSMYNINDGKPITVCFICCAHLRKAHQLMRRAVKAEELLTSIISNRFEQTQEALSAIASERDLDYSYVTKQLYQGECKEFEKDIIVEIKKEIESESEEDNAVEIEIDIKEEKYDYSDSLQEDKLDLADTKPGALSAHDEHIKKEVRIILQKIDPDQVTKHKVNEVAQNAKRRKLGDTTENRKPSPDAETGICNPIPNVQLNVV
ncbi:hypothetical protein K1T71_000761 [Dendrolimus kikuchii]|uniref:Uncharacterized protein n=1 Tax=Dendrolimus kikuchii TaxID=765133 RepID=A0ACC1DK43_9NEOP|nr:hypothetical protein K1T71_000761 [Dendrolimus kikuchii]